MILKNENFKDLISSEKVLVDFYADWCGPCKMMQPVLEQLDIKIIKVNIDEHEDIAREYKVLSIPTLILFDNGSEVKKIIGYTPLEVLKDWIK